MLTFDDIKGWSREEAKARLSSSGKDVADIIRIAAEAGVTEAQAAYGQLLLDGKTIAKNETEALHWFGLAAKSGYAMAMNMVGRCCDQGWGTAVDKALAAQWFDAAARLGLDWGMYNLATLYCLGEGVAVDRAAAYRLFEQAARLGHAKSVNMLGGFYEDGWVVARDMDIAASLYRQAAEAGDFRGAFNHARMLINADRMRDAADWLRTIPDLATEAFIQKVRHWLSDHPDAAVKKLASSMQSIPRDHVPFNRLVDCGS